MEASDIAVPAINYRAVDFVVGRGGKQRLDLFLLGKYSVEWVTCSSLWWGCVCHLQRDVKFLLGAVSPALLPRFLCVIHHTLFSVARLAWEQME